MASFVLIEQAVRILALARPAELAEAIRFGVDSSFYVDPTLAQRYLAQRGDMDRKLKILDDAARLMSNWSWPEEALAEQTQAIEVYGGEENPDLLRAALHAFRS